MRDSRHPSGRLWVGFWLFLLGLLAGSASVASSPRWTTGAPYFNANVTGRAVVWYTNQPLYYTDPGDLSPYANHAAADAMVAAAAGVWNVPMSAMVLQQGGNLNEQVSSQDVYLGQNGLVFPADVQASNYAAKQIAVVYDRDGSVTDLLLGGGASDPVGCLTNGVTESVDSIAPSGVIQHAVLLLNGRCITAAPESLQQMQYQLERAFGRVLGLGWSQLNDNVFMGVPQPTYSQALHWPIMHPIDVLCGKYSYQCLPQPFTLRDDDVASLVFLYPIAQGNVPAGKQASLTNASDYQGNLRFFNQEGMAGVNVIVRRNELPQQVLEDYDDVSAVSGIFAQQIGGNPVTPKPATLAGSFGEIFPYYDVAGYFHFAYIPVAPGHPADDLLLHTEAINPLYSGEYAIAPYTLSPVTPSGDPTVWRFNYVTPFWSVYYEPPDHNLANSCSTGSEGTESSPSPTPAGGWWTSVICGANDYPNQWSFAHTSWVSLPVKANRSLTVEMTGLNEAGIATGNKVRPALGVWSAGDAFGSAPSLGSAGVAFNSVVAGMTAASAQVSQADTLRIALTSETGDGRPDYSYQARVLYADAISPGTAGAGTQVVISGIGFRTGNTVTVGGVRASVSSWTATTITATVPRIVSVPVGQTATVDVVVTDLSTKGATVMSGAFVYVYTAPTYVLKVVGAPSGSQFVSYPTTPAFTVQVVDVDDITPLASTPVVFSVATGSVAWGACGGASCTVLTDTNGMATTSVTPLAAGTVTLQAAAVGQTQQASFQAVVPVRTATVTPQYKYLAAGATGSWVATASFTQQGQAAANAPVSWSATGGALTISGAQATTDASGMARATVQAGPLAAVGQATGMVCGWGNVCVPFTAFGVDPQGYEVVITGGGSQTIAASASFVPVTAQITDAGGNPVAGVAVQIHQATRAWTVPCAGKGRCPTAPVQQTSDTTVLSDGNGNLSFPPLDQGGTEVTSIVVSAGGQGYASLTLTREP